MIKTDTRILMKKILDKKAVIRENLQIFMNVILWLTGYLKSVTLSLSEKACYKKGFLKEKTLIAMEQRALFRSQKKKKVYCVFTFSHSFFCLIKPLP
jgi:hypothetical protein